MNVNEVKVLDMGNMSTLEKKVDVLMRFLMAQTDTERQQCYGDLRALQQLTDMTMIQPGWVACIDRTLRELGVPDHLRGHDYLRTAISLVLQMPDAIHYVTGVIYPQVAKHHQTVPAAVERGIRHAIECGWDRCDIRTRDKYFANQIEPGRGKPTNTQFIARIVNVVRCSKSPLQN